MRRRLHHLIIAVPLIFSIGGHWALLQSGAWVSMLISFSKNDSVVEAVGKTFDGKHPCKVCKFVADGKKSEKQHEHQLSKVKIDFFLVANSAHGWSPGGFDLQFPFVAFASETDDSPPIPPPKFC